MVTVGVCSSSCHGSVCLPAAPDVSVLDPALRRPAEVSLAAFSLLITGTGFLQLKHSHTKQCSELTYHLERECFADWSEV